MAETVRIEIPIHVVDKTDPELSNSMNQIKKVDQAMNGVNQSAKGVQNGISSVAKGLKEADQAMESTINSTKKANTHLSKFDQTAEKTQKSLWKWAKEKHQILLEAKDQISPVLATLGSGLKHMESKAWKVTMKAIDLATAPIRGIIHLLTNPVLQMGAVFGISVGLGDTINTYKEFEATMSQVQAISGATGVQLEKLTEKAKEMGATTKFTAAEAGEAFQYMAMAGWDTQQMLDGVDGILNLAAASGEDLGTTSDIVTDALTAFGLKASDATHFSDVLAKAASSANTNVSMMGETFKYAGAMAGTLGYSIEDVGVMIGLMANNGIKASQAGTELNSLFTRLSTNTNGARDAIEKLGIRFYSSSGKARPLAEVMNELRVATADYNDEQKTNLANTIAGQRAQAGLLAILNTSTEDYEKLTEAIYHADGAAAEMSNTMLNNLSGSITLLQSAIDGVKISFGERLSPYVRSLADWLTAQMPAVEQGLDEFMDWFDTKVDRMQRKFHAIADTKEWQGADFFGKVKIAWDEFIVEPFSTWWSSTGKKKLASILSSIGNGIGTGLKCGILALLGIDLSDTTNEAACVGIQFAKGFSEGFDFDFMKSKLWEGIKNLFADAAKLLPGGESAGLSSLFSALLIRKMASPFVGMGMGGFQIGKALFGKGESGKSVMGSLIGQYSLAGEIAGTGMAEGSGLLGLLGKAGLLFGSGATTSTGLIAAGTAGVAGTVAGGASILSGLFDAYQAIHSENKKEKTAYGSSSGLKIGGAAIGAMFGSMILPGLGTAIGTGIGGTLGSLVGNIVKKDYQKREEKEQKELEELQRQAEKGQKILEATGFSMDEMKLKSDALIQAMNDSEVSAEQFIQLFQEECTAVAKGAFGAIALSLEDVKKIASELTFADMADGIERFSQISFETEAAWEHLESSVSHIKKENWNVNLGIQLSDSDKSNYRSEVDNFVKSAQSYLQEKHYEATLALQLLTNEEVDVSGLNRFYGGLKGKIETANEELQRVLSEALADGVISTEDKISVKIGGIEYEMDEASAIAKLQKQITDVTDKVAQAQTEAQFQTLQIRYKDASLNLDSFHAMQKELQANMQAAEEQYSEALTVTLTNLRLELIDGAITAEEYDRAVAEATKGYYAKLDKVYASVSDFSLENIAAAFDTELAGILPELEGTTKEKLEKLLEHALLIQPDVTAWTEPDVIRWMGLDQLELDDVQQTTIAMELKQTAFAMPEGIKEKMLQDYKNVVPTKEELMAAIDFTEFSYEEWESLLNFLDPSEAGQFFSGITDKVQPLVDADAKEFEALCENYATVLSHALEKNKDLDVLTRFKEEYMGDFFQDMAGQGPISNPYYETLLEEYRTAGTNWGDAMNTGVIDSLSSGSSRIRMTAEQSISSAFQNPFYVTAQINVTGKHTLMDGYFSQNVPVTGHALGGYVGGKQLSWIGEEGPEAIIPLIPSRRQRAFQLYEQVGDILGIAKNATGGIVNYTNIGNVTGDEFVQQEPISIAGVQQTADAGVQVNVQMSPEIHITCSENQSEDSILEVIRKHMKEMADELGGELAERLELVLSNMPRKGVS